MSENIAWTFPAGKLIDNAVVKGTAAAAGKGNFSEDEDEHRMTVPAGKRWLLFCMAALPDVSATVGVSVHNSDDQALLACYASAAGTALISWPSFGGDGFTGAGVFPVPLKAGDYIKVEFGAQQAATAYITAVVLEIDV